MINNRFSYRQTHIFKLLCKLVSHTRLGVEGVRQSATKSAVHSVLRCAGRAYCTRCATLAACTNSGGGRVGGRGALLTFHRVPGISSLLNSTRVEGGWQT